VSLVLYFLQKMKLFNLSVLLIALVLTMFSQSAIGNPIKNVATSSKSHQKRDTQVIVIENNGPGGYGHTRRNKFRGGPGGPGGPFMRGGFDPMGMGEGEMGGHMGGPMLRPMGGPMGGPMRDMGRGGFRH